MVRFQHEMQTRRGLGFVALFLTLVTENTPQCAYSLREVVNGLRWIACMGAPWRMMSSELPSWHTVYQQTQRWLKAKVFESLVRDLRMVLRDIDSRTPALCAVVFDARAMQATPERGACQLRRV